MFGVAAGAKAGLRIPRAYWQKVMKHWRTTQRPDGGWAYGGTRGKTRDTMTAAGLVSLLICTANLTPGAKGGKVTKSIEAAIAKLDKAVANTTSTYGYFLFGLARVSWARQDLRHSKKWTWYKPAEKRLLAIQQPDGSFEGTSDSYDSRAATAFAVLTMACGQKAALANRRRPGDAIPDGPVELADDQRKRLEKKARMLSEQLARDPKDAKIRAKLIGVYLLELDEPVEAEKLLAADTDPAFRKFVPVAAKKVASLGETDALALAKWYMTLSGQDNRVTERTALTRAIRYYRQFLKVHRTKDARRLKVRQALDQAGEAIERLAPPRSK